MESSLMEVIGTDRKSNWLARLLRLLTLRRLTDPGAMAGDASIAFCAGMALAAWLIVDRLQWGPGVEFDSFGISMLALAALLGLALAYVMARLSRPLLPMRYTLLFVVAPLPLLIAADALLGMWLTERWDALTWALLAVCLLVYAARALRAVSGKLQIRAVLAAAALLAAYFWLGQRIDLRPTFWAPPDNVDAPDAAMSPQIAEALLFEQRDRLDEALQAVDDSGTDPSRSSVFFVGFAGVASQKVFAEEIKLAARVVGQRFDSSERQLLLINDHRDFDSYPLATVSGLRYALGEIAKKMNIERDILFLSLSSHGSDEPLLSVSNGVLPLEQVSGENLASALRDSGIKWRVIVISACHAGAFIGALQDPDTVLITAAAADRTSFGCSDDRDLTYFGEAFYRDALPRAKTLRDAFALTREAIAKRELDEHVTASEPQAFFGERIERLLSRQAIRAPAP
jgi:xanthosine utilization system XapX-like protein